ncbi:hypothetical protein EV643_115239 [Kribbella sp. VKM Ac-2527]|uniref:WD40 repeat protein n=1 Tax=Kribbella caucasensis TaxID=2512215 RepID=A0A4R6K5Y1_9ACTN|nr:hypothetical protein [Kribbella sp. VKM Ac-2527]TDO44737.1 hypothetical protein EV643_115239 [Kribbella sp. VKM Ac-2527]
MTDTETRLRDYLQSQADTIPDTSQPPDLDLGRQSPRRLWPILAAAAAIGAVLILTVPLLTGLTRQDQKPADKPAALGVPYVLIDKEQVLHDREQTVPIPSDHGSLNVSEQVSGGWATTWMDRPGGTSFVGILRPDGKITSIGPANALGVQASPDGSQVVTSVPNGKGGSRLVVLDVATGRELASQTVPYAMVGLLGWNKNGIWLHEDYAPTTTPVLWDPTTGTVTEVKMPGYAHGLSAPAASDRILVTTRTGEAWCLKTGRLTDGKLAVDREYCGTGGPHNYPALSPDGQTIVDSARKKVIDVETGKVTNLRVDGEMPGWPQPVFEDDTHLLVLTRGSGDVVETSVTPGVGRLEPASVRHTVYRCDVTTGSCDAAYTSPPVYNLQLLEP